MKRFLLDPNVLYPIGTKMWSCELGDCFVAGNNCYQDYTYKINSADPENERNVSYTSEGKYHFGSNYPSLFLHNPFKSITDEEVIKLQNRKVIVGDFGHDIREEKLAFEYKGNFFTYMFDKDLDYVVANKQDQISFMRWDNCSEIQSKPKLTKKQICEKFGLDDFELKD